MSTAFDHAQALYDAAEPEWDDGDEVGGDLLNAQQVSDNLIVLLNAMGFMDDGDLESAGLDGLLNVNRVTSFANGGVMTRDAGFTLTLDNGSEYQITVVRSR